VSLVVRDWGESKATKERVEGVVVVVLVLVLGDHGGYYVDCHHFHHHHQLRQRPTIASFPNLEGVEPNPTIPEDSHDGGVRAPSVEGVLEA